MTYAASETAFLAEEGHGDLLLAYPTARRSDAELIAGANARGATAAVIVDDVAHLEALDAAASAAKTRVPVVVDIDLSYRPVASLHIGVRRSPLRTPEQVVAFARRIAGFAHLRFHGLMGYEAQIAGLPDFSRGKNGVADGAKRAMKALSRTDVAKTRAAIVAALRAAGLAPALFNGGGTGSVASAVREDALTEVTAGSGFVDSHLFDGYRGLALTPAIFFALQVVRRPAPRIVTCHGGGFIASGQAGADRLPIPALPEGLSLLPLEGAGEVQTPVACARGVDVAIGEPIFFRHAKAGELSEHFNEYLFIRGDRIVERTPTYRGLGKCFLG
jgi:D-serine deaminase-like pyridoxal phosphate-dependent protein